MHPAYRYPLFLLVGFLISFASSSQTPKIDSLKKVLASLPPEGRSYRNDTIRMLVLCELGKESIGKKITPYIEQAILEANTLGWPKGIMVAYFHHGMHYGALGSYYRASQSLFKALSVSERLQDVQMSSKILLNLGNFYQVMGNAMKGLEFHLKALNYARNLPDIKLKLLNLIGTDYVRLSNYSKAEYYLLKGRKLAKLYGNKRVESYCIGNTAIIYTDLKKYDKADIYFKQYDSLLTEINGDKIDMHFGLSKLYLSQNLYRKALKEAEIVRQMAGKDFFNLMLAYESLYKVYEKQGDTKNALLYYKALTELKDTNEKEMKQRQIEALKYEYEFENQRVKIEILEITSQENEIIIRIVSVFCVLIFCGLLYLNKKNKKINYQRSQVLQLKDELAESNRQLLIFNEDLEKRVVQRTAELTIANEELILKNREIQMAFFNGKSQERKRVASELHDNLGSTISALVWQLEGLKPETLSLSEQRIYEGLIEQMRNAYVEIRHISHHLLPSELRKGLKSALIKLITDLNTTGKIMFTLNTDEFSNSLNQTQELELYSICLELINNTLKHSKATDCSLIVQSRLDCFEIVISDNGEGFDLKKIGKRGKGLENIKGRVEALGGDLIISTKKAEGASFFITIPLVNSPENLSV